MNLAFETEHAQTALAREGLLLTGQAACAPFNVDGLEPKCVALPRSEGEVVQILKYATENDLAVIPCRNATNLGLGNVPRQYNVALCLKEMNRVWRYEPDDLTLTVEPGIKLSDLQRFLSRHRLWLPVDPPGAGRGSLGGIVATNAAGPLRLRYGTPRDFVLGMKVATAEGPVIKAGGSVVKNVAGYDLCRLLTGSCGTLGVIVEISLKLFPQPVGRASWRLAMSSLEAARNFRRGILDSPLNPLRMVLLDGGGAAIAAGEQEAVTGFEIWLEYGGSERVLRRVAQTLQGLVRAVDVTLHPVEENMAEEGWNRIADFALSLASSPAQAILLKATLPIAASEEFMGLGAGELRKYSARHACMCQNGVGIVYLGLVPEELSTPLVNSIARLRDAAVSLGGALVIERAPRELKKEIDVWGLPGSDFALMRKLKETWDPKRILSPGRFVGGL